MKKINWVAIDDDELILNFLKDLMENQENFHQMATFSDPLEGTVFLKENDVDLLILDIHMPVISGLELLEFYNSECNIIVISGDLSIKNEVKDSPRVIGVLEKPIDSQQLSQILNRITI